MTLKSLIKSKAVRLAGAGLLGVVLLGSAGTAQAYGYYGHGGGWHHGGYGYRSGFNVSINDGYYGRPYYRPYYYEPAYYYPPPAYYAPPPPVVYDPGPRISLGFHGRL